MAAVPNFMADNAMIQMLIIEQKRSRKQAVCALETLKKFGYGPGERYHMLKDPTNNIHMLCYFGNIWIFFFLVLFFLALALYSLMAIGMRLWEEYCINFN
jgi:hypothetical protein